jgi:hypothetical protein
MSHSFPFRLEGNVNTIVTLANASKTEDLEYTLNLFYGGKTYIYDGTTLRPGEVRNVDVKALRDQQTPGANKQLIDPAITSGQVVVHFRGRKHMADGPAPAEGQPHHAPHYASAVTFDEERKISITTCAMQCPPEFYDAQVTENVIWEGYLHQGTFSIAITLWDAGGTQMLANPADVQWYDTGGSAGQASGMDFTLLQAGYDSAYANVDLWDIYCPYGFSFCGCYGAYAVVAIAVYFTVTQAQCSVSFQITTPQQVYISAFPAMPQSNGQVTGLNPSNASVSWTGTITHTSPGSNCSGGPTFTETQNGSGTYFSPIFSDFYGGTLTISASCSASGWQSYTAPAATVQVKGTQPAVADIAAQIGTMSSPFDPADLRRVACKESAGLLQFTSAGDPVYGQQGTAGDVGIMQACYNRVTSYIWNWRANVERGRTILNDSKNYAKSFLDNKVATAGATPYTTSQWREQSIHSYNAGNNPASDFYWNWVPGNPGSWQIVDSGGIGGYVPGVTGESATCQ